MGFRPFGEPFGRGNFANPLGQGGRTVIPVNTVAPAISATSVIGTQITGDDGTWLGAPTFTYQWQRNTGSFVDIGGATSKNYTPVDADFGYALRLVVTPNFGTAVNSNSTNLTQEAPVQTLGAELLTDGAMEVWDSATVQHTPWTKSIAGTSSLDKESVIVHGGSFAARLTIDAINSLALIAQPLSIAAGDYVEATVWSRAAAGTPGARMDLGSTGITLALSATYKRYRALTRSPSLNAGQNFFRVSANTILYFDDASDKKNTLNTQLVAPSANMRLTQLFTLPTPDPGTQVWVMPRISDFASGNYWLVHLLFTTTLQWDITLYSVAAHTRTSRTSASNIGVVNGIRINCNGDLLDLQTTVDSGANWVTRGSQVNNALYNTATGANVQSTSDVSLGTLTYEAAV